uniref:Uncharacterized protein n=1 Tax=Ascaris lumbricoides TaxID=6252 RepID=A0A0M3IE63_ASCLU
MLPVDEASSRRFACVYPLTADHSCGEEVEEQFLQNEEDVHSLEDRTRVSDDANATRVQVRKDVCLEVEKLELVRHGRTQPVGGGHR